MSYEQTEEIKRLTDAERALWEAESAVADPMTAACWETVSELLPREYRGGMTKFTGWKYGTGQHSGFVAQVVWNPGEDQRTAGMRRIFVNLPGFECGHFDAGDSFDIGTMRLLGGESVQVLEDLTAGGIQCLLNLVDRYHGAREMCRSSQIGCSETIKTWLAK